MTAPTSKTSNEHWERIFNIFEVARDLDESEREHFQEKECGEDHEALVEVKDLLAHSTSEDQFLMRPVLGHSFNLAKDSPDALERDFDDSFFSPGDQVGSFTIDRVLGSGGMGVVYEASQDFPSRAVALKVMRMGLSMRQSARRFKYEVECLAKLKHENIAKVINAGVHYQGEGVRSHSSRALPYFAMEFVDEALPIDKYILEKELSTKEIIKLYVRVCEGVAHGHLMGIIHRDLKPDNILVGKDGVPKIIDFGVACTTDTDLAITTMLTDVGQLIGTVRYMSPEQCSGDRTTQEAGGPNVDMRSDLYSLGIILYELVCHESPYEEIGSSVASCLNAVCNAEVVLPRKRIRNLKGDLEAVMLKAIDRDPKMRYQSAASLGQDLQHLLANEPVSAKQPSMADLFLRWVGRNWIVASTAASILIGMLIIGGSYVGLQISLNYPTHIAKDGERGMVLKSVSDARLREWPDVFAAQLVDRPDEMGGGRAAIIVNPRNINTEDDLKENCVSIQSVGFGGRTEGVPVFVEEPNPPSYIAALAGGENDLTNYDSFRLRDMLLVADFFQGSQHPGQEFLVVRIARSGPSCIQIINLKGEVLYTRWHSGHIGDVTWLKEKQVLVCEAVRDDQIPHEIHTKVGNPGFALPRTVFALSPRPTPGEEISEILDPACEIRDRPLWCKVVCPASLWVDLPRDSFDPVITLDGQEAARWVLMKRQNQLSANELRSGEIASVHLAIDGDGELIQQPWVSNAYRDTERLPDPATVRLLNYTPTLNELLDFYYDKN